MASNIIKMINQLSDDQDNSHYSIGHVHGYLSGLYDGGLLTKDEYDDYRELADKKTELPCIVASTPLTNTYS